MKYANIATSLGWTETPETQEGLFLQPEEAACVDKALGESAANATRADELISANTLLEQTVAGHETTISTQATKITELEAQVAKLGSAPSGNGSVVTTPASDEHADQKPVPSYLSDDNPANAWIDSKIKKK